jgi:hypothetical protein
MKQVVYSPHLNFRLKLRNIPKNLPRQIFATSNERYFDSETQKSIAVKDVLYKGKVREIALTYEQNTDRITLITIHPLKNLQKTNRIKSGRWIKI